MDILPLIAEDQSTSSGWWYTYPSEKYEVVSWDDEIPNIWKFIENIPKHQPEYVYPKSWLITVL